MTPYLLFIFILVVVKSPAVLVLKIVTGGLVVVIVSGVVDLSGFELINGFRVVLHFAGSLNKGLQWVCRYV